ncbi:cytochrome P450 CYP749A22-like isoform X2 [Rhodamnia argentea]|uniref:Cytochrome P450 CYP749A22-like isoform X2 n=1 Tax=Rhodamnia argentea TaxID=178133 RepID=A0ABM3HKA8_9MYRT|nr:cytochrome P450 CYP749A22-like isoform X2 [Rhodamnia argentea]
MGLVIFLSSLFLFLLPWSLAKLLHKLWWSPLTIQRMMAQQGITGPPYRFLHGTTKETIKMRMKVKNTPMSNLSHDVFPKIQPQINAWIDAYGRNFLNWHGPQAQLVITEPELIKEVLLNRERTYTKTGTKDFTKKLLGDGLVSTADGKKWAKQRKLANHAFHGESLKNMAPAMVESVHTMLGRWKDQAGKEIEVFGEFRFLTCEVISRTAFGSSYVEGRNIFQMLTGLSSLTAKNSFNIRLPGMSKLWKTADEVEAEKLEKGIRDSIVQMIKRREKKVIAGEADGYGDDFLGQLVKALHDGDKSKKITVDNLVDECKTFYIAGQETGNSMMTWMLFLLAMYPEWQEEARKEVLNVFGNRDPDSDGLGKLKKVGMIINETLRLYPPVVGLFRKVAKKQRCASIQAGAVLRRHSQGYQQQRGRVHPLRLRTSILRRDELRGGRSESCPFDDPPALHLQAVPGVHPLPRSAPYNPPAIWTSDQISSSAVADHRMMLSCNSARTPP